MELVLRGDSITAKDQFHALVSSPLQVDARCSDGRDSDQGYGGAAENRSVAQIGLDAHPTREGGLEEGSDLKPDVRQLERAPHRLGRNG